MKKQTSANNSKYYCIDLFAGCGGLSLGLEQAGFTPLLFSEINDSAAKTYKANRVNGVIQIGDIYDYDDEKIEEHLTAWKTREINEIDLVCGGPPCQGYSGIGHRRTFNLAKKDIPSNHLYEEMVRVIRKVNPKIFLFENVKGLLNARWKPTGSKGEIFKAVRKAFATLTNYIIRWDLIVAKDYGVPQNRPRVIMIGIRKDILPAPLKHLKKTRCPDLPLGVSEGFLPTPFGKPPTLFDLLSDLIDPNYLVNLETKNYLTKPLSEIQVFLRTKLDGTLMKKGDPITDHVYSNHAKRIVEKYAYMIANNGQIPPQFQTKKFATRVFPKTWGLKGPNITATSLSEDFVHFSQPRSPTVREMARIQTFPDWYLFEGPRTTGGRRRAGDPSIGVWDREVPKYTQIGNAVPPLLGKAIGMHLSKLLT
jgi:DNA (cytosine-5)-methyltransferase 1